jgi:hypothetical protein
MDKRKITKRIILGTEQFFIDNKNLSCKEQIELYEKEYGVKLTPYDIGGIRKRLHITAPKGETFKLNKEQEEYLKSIITKPSKDIIDLFYKKYNKQFTIEQIWYYRRKWKPKNVEHRGHFKKGYTPHNKGNIGDIELHKNGYYFIKIADNKRYQRYGRYMWEKYHNKKIPKGYSVVYLNQDKSDFSKDNLVLVKNEELVIAKNRGLLTNSKKATKVGLTVAKLENKTSKMKKEIHI